MKRRSFLIRAGGALIAVPAALKLSACGDDGGGNGGGDPDASNNNGDSFTVSNTGAGTNHPHSFTVQCSDLESTSDVTFTASGSGHTHSVTLTADELAMVANGQTVTVQTSDGHPHTWEVTAGNQCA